MPSSLARGGDVNETILWRLVDDLLRGNGKSLFSYNFYGVHTYLNFDDSDDSILFTVCCDFLPLSVFLTGGKIGVLYYSFSVMASGSNVTFFKLPSSCFYASATVIS